MNLKFGLSAILALMLPVAGWAQGFGGDWTFSQRFEGTNNASGAILKTDTSVGLILNPNLHVRAGLPIYFARPSAAVAAEGEPQFLNGLGNFYMGVEVPLQVDIVNYTADLTVALPTGSEDRGFNTGEVTFDWTNRFSRSFGSITPFGSLSVANTIADRFYFVRPFSSVGLVGQLEGGALLEASPTVSVGGLAYSVRASSDQRIVSRLLERPVVPGPGPGIGQNGRVFETVADIRVPAQAANDHGFAAWVDVRPDAGLDFQVGYGRNIRYGLDSLFFSVGLNLVSIQ